MPIIDFGNEWRAVHLGKGIYKVFYAKAKTTRYLTMTGSAVISQLKIPFPHRILKFQWVHTDSAKALGNDALSIEVYRGQDTMFPPKFKDHLFRAYDLTSQSGCEWFGVGFEFESANWSISFNSTSTDLVYPLFHIQKLGDVQ